jgi:hypothetical protein
LLDRLIRQLGIIDGACVLAGRSESIRVSQQLLIQADDIDGKVQFQQALTYPTDVLHLQIVLVLPAEMVRVAAPKTFEQQRTSVSRPSLIGVQSHQTGNGLGLDWPDDIRIGLDGMFQQRNRRVARFGKAVQFLTDRPAHVARQSCNRLLIAEIIPPVSAVPPRAGRYANRSRPASLVRPANPDIVRSARDRLPQIGQSAGPGDSIQDAVKRQV